MTPPRYYIGLISGTSVDAADAAVAVFPEDGPPQVIATHAERPDPKLRDDLLQLSQQVAGVSLAMFGELNQRVGAWLADAAIAVMREAGVTAADVAAIGSHGQTVRHEPDALYPFSLQLGAPSLIAARTGCRVVADFRNSDIAYGGQGAPLVCAFHQHMFADREQDRVVVNIGGIANLTLLPRAAADDAGAVTGLDTGPGNALMDAWVGAHFDRPMDADGRWAAAGQVDAALLAQMMNDSYFSRPAPKSTGREYFNLDWLQAQINSINTSPRPVDVQATLCEFSARSIAQGIDDYGPGHETLLMCGGGMRNAELWRRLALAADPRPLVATDSHGVDADWVEALAFAWLAKRTVNGQTGNLPTVTGARCAIPLGGIYQPISDS